MPAKRPCLPATRPSSHPPTTCVTSQNTQAADGWCPAQLLSAVTGSM
jgi:hypothetical protein